MILINDFGTTYDRNMVPNNQNCSWNDDVGTHYDQNCTWNDNINSFDTHYDRNCDQDDDQDHPINDFCTHYDQNCDHDDDNSSNNIRAIDSDTARIDNINNSFAITNINAIQNTILFVILIMRYTTMEAMLL